jgi:hypothetical protein
LNYFNFSLLASKDDKLTHLARSVLFPIFIENRRIRAKFALLCRYEITRVTAKDFNIMKLDFEFHPIHAIKTIPSTDRAPEDPLGYRFRGLSHTHIKSHLLSEINYAHTVGLFFGLCNNSIQLFHILCNYVNGDNIICSRARLYKYNILIKHTIFYQEYAKRRF